MDMVMDMDMDMLRKALSIRNNLLTVFETVKCPKASISFVRRCFPQPN